MPDPYYPDVDRLRRELDVAGYVSDARDIDDATILFLYRKGFDVGHDEGRDAAEHSQADA